MRRPRLDLLAVIANSPEGARPGSPAAALIGPRIGFWRRVLLVFNQGRTA